MFFELYLVPKFNHVNRHYGMSTCKFLLFLDCLQIVETDSFISIKNNVTPHFFLSMIGMEIPIKDDCKMSL
jgi:hypothetical protein